MTAVYPLVRFVDAPEESANVRLDLNSIGVWADERIAPAHEGFSIGAPTLEGDPDGIGVEYGLRTISFSLHINGSRQASLRAMEALAREVQRRRNWLMVQLDDSSAPVWFRTYVSQPGEVSFDRVFNDGRPDGWVVGVQLSADAHALGARETLATVTVANDPTAASNPMSFIVSDIKGDAPAPVRIGADFSANLDQADIVWSVCPVPDDFTAPLSWDIGTGDGWTAGTDTGAAVADAAYSGGSYREVTFATDAGMATRLYGSAPESLIPGKYRVFVRVARSDDSSEFAFKLGYRDFFGDVMGGAETVRWDRGTSTSTGLATWVPLGTRSFPQHYDDSLRVPGFTDFNPDISLQVERTSGTGALRLDSLLLVPVHLAGMDEPGRMLGAEFTALGPQSADTASYWDGDAEAYTRVNGFGVVTAAIQPIPHGDFPVLHPGVANAVHLIQQSRLVAGYFGATDNGDSITRTATVTLSYHPRHLWLGAD